MITNSAIKHSENLVNTKELCLARLKDCVKCLFEAEKAFHSHQLIKSAHPNWFQKEMDLKGLIWKADDNQNMAVRDLLTAIRAIHLFETSLLESEYSNDTSY